MGYRGVPWGLWAVLRRRWVGLGRALRVLGDYRSLHRKSERWQWIPAPCLSPPVFTSLSHCFVFHLRFVSLYFRFSRFESSVASIRIYDTQEANELADDTKKEKVAFQFLVILVLKNKYKYRMHVSKSLRIWNPCFEMHVLK